MSEEDLELLITLDDPEEATDEDTFNHPPTDNTLEYWLGDVHEQTSGLPQKAQEVSKKS